MIVTYDRGAMKTPQFSPSGQSRTLGSAALAAMLVLPLAAVVWAAGSMLPVLSKVTRPGGVSTSALPILMAGVLV